MISIISDVDADIINRSDFSVTAIDHIRNRTKSTRNRQSRWPRRRCNRCASATRISPPWSCASAVPARPKRRRCFRCAVPMWTALKAGVRSIWTLGQSDKALRLERCARFMCSNLLLGVDAGGVLEDFVELELSQLKIKLFEYSKVLMNNEVSHYFMNSIWTFRNSINAGEIIQKNTSKWMG